MAVELSGLHYDTQNFPLWSCFKKTNLGRIKQESNGFSWLIALQTKTGKHTSFLPWMFDSLQHLERYVARRAAWQPEEESSKDFEVHNAAEKTDVDRQTDLAKEAMQEQKRVKSREARKRYRQRQKEKIRSEEGEAQSKESKNQKRKRKAEKVKKSREAKDAKNKAYKEKRPTLLYKLKNSKNLVFTMLPFASLSAKFIPLDTRAFEVSPDFLCCTCFSKLKLHQPKIQW